MKPIHTNGQANYPTAEEREQARLIAGFAYFENGRAKFPEAYGELIKSVLAAAYLKPDAFLAALSAAGEETTELQKYALGQALVDYGAALKGADNA